MGSHPPVGGERATEASVAAGGGERAPAGGSPATPPGGAMPELDFAVEGVRAMEHTAVPTVAFDVRIAAPEGVRIRSAALNVQLRIAATRRRYDPGARERLVELFGAADQWGRSLRSLHWVNVALNVGPFEGSTVVELPVTCTYDLDVTATRYFDALADGEVPVELLFAGSVFYAAERGALAVAPIGWDREAECRMPVATWREAIDRHFPDGGWLRLGGDSLARLQAYKARNALPTWDRAIDALVEAAEGGPADADGGPGAPDGAPSAPSREDTP